MGAALGIHIVALLHHRWKLACNRLHIGVMASNVPQRHAFANEPLLPLERRFEGCGQLCG